MIEEIRRKNIVNTGAWNVSERRFKGSIVRLCHLLRQLRSGRLRGITCSGKTDGMGSQVQGVMSVMAFAKALGVTYLHAPFEKVEYALSEQWIQGCEEFFGLGKGEKTLAEATADCDVLALAPKNLNECYRSITNAANETAAKGRGLVLSLKASHFYTDSIPNQLSYLTSTLRAKCQLPAPLKDRDAEFIVAVHIRRGDVVTEAQDGTIVARPKLAIRFTPNDEIEAVVRECFKRFANTGKQLRVQIVSEGKVEDFAQFVALGCEICLDEDPMDAVRRLMTADVVLVAKSSFSYVAAVLNKGTVIYEPFWHPPLADWQWLREFEAGETEATFARSTDVKNERIIANRSQSGNSLEWLKPIANGQYDVDIRIDASLSPFLLLVNGVIIAANADPIGSHAVTHYVKTDVTEGVMAICLYTESAHEATIDLVRIKVLPPPPPPKTFNAILYGTSNSMMKYALASVFEKNQDVTRFRNASLGSSSSVHIARSIHAIDFSQFDYCMLDFSVNEGYLLADAGLSTTEIEPNVRYLIASALSAGCLPVVLFFPTIKGKSLDVGRDCYLDLAARFNLPYCDGYRLTEIAHDKCGLTIPEIFLNKNHAHRWLSFIFGELVIAQLQRLLPERRLRQAAHWSAPKLSQLLLKDLVLTNHTVATRKSSKFEEHTVLIDVQNPLEVPIPVGSEVVGICINLFRTHSHVEITGEQSCILDLRGSYYDRGDSLVAAMLPFPHPIAPKDGVVRLRALLDDQVPPATVVMRKLELGTSRLSKSPGVVDASRLVLRSTSDFLEMTELPAKELHQDLLATIPTKEIVGRIKRGFEANLAAEAAQKAAKETPAPTD